MKYVAGKHSIIPQYPLSFNISSLRRSLIESSSRAHRETWHRRPESFGQKVRLPAIFTRISINFTSWSHNASDAKNIPKKTTASSNPSH